MGPASSASPRTPTSALCTPPRAADAARSGEQQQPGGAAGADDDAGHTRRRSDDGRRRRGGERVAPRRRQDRAGLPEEAQANQSHRGPALLKHDFGGVGISVALAQRKE